MFEGQRHLKYSLLWLVLHNAYFLMPVSRVHRTMWFVGKFHLWVLGSRHLRRHQEVSCKSQSIRVRRQDEEQNTHNHQFYLYRLHEPSINLSLRCFSARRHSAEHTIPV